MKLILTLLSISSIFLINSKPVKAITTTLYDGSGLPEDNEPQWLDSGAIDSEGNLLPFLSGNTVDGGVEVDSNAIGFNGNNAEYFGYSNYNPLSASFINSSFPTLDRDSGYSIFLNVSLDTVNDFSDTDDNNRAAFSVTAIGSDNQGIEIGFDSNQIFAQSSTFTQVATETQAFSTSNSIDYQLQISGNTYQLLANSGDGFSPVINGSLRTYDFEPSTSEPPLAFDPYEIPNFLFFGDNTGQAHGTFTLGEISVDTASVPFNFSPTLGLALVGIGFATRKLGIGKKTQL